MAKPHPHQYWAVCQNMLADNYLIRTMRPKAKRRGRRRLKKSSRRKRRRKRRRRRRRNN